MEYWLLDIFIFVQTFFIQLVPCQRLLQQECCVKMLLLQPCTLMEEEEDIY